MVKQDRSIGMYILLSIVTLGIYNLYFVYAIAQDMNIVCEGDGEKTEGLLVFILLGMVTCGIYTWIWYYKIANRQQFNAGRYNLNFVENGSSVILWMLVGSLLCGIGYYVGINIIIKNMNSLAYVYNSQTYNGQSQNYGGQPQNYGGQPQNYGGQPQNYGGQPQNYNGQAQQNNFDQTDKSVEEISLLCKYGEFAGCSFPVKKNERVVIGRDLTCNIKFDANTPKISRQHCIFEYDGNNMWLTDSNSKCGTFLMDGTKLQPMQKTMIKSGTEFYLGSQSITFSV